MVARLLALLVALFTLPASAQVLYPPFLTSVESSYTWSLGDLADQSARLTDAVLWDDGSWADPYDTEAELTALGWQTVDIQCVDLYDNAATPQTTGSPDGNCDLDRTIARIDCADGGSGTGGDETAIRALIAAACPNGAGGSGDANKDCAVDAGNFDTAGDRAGVIMKYPSGSCHIDMLSGTGVQNDAIGGLPLRYSNIAIVGDGMDNSFLDCNDTATESTSLASCVGTNYTSFGTPWAGTPGACTPGSSINYGASCEATTTYTVTGSITVGQTSINLGGTPCSTLSAGDRIVLKGTGPDGDTLWASNFVSSCTVNGGDDTVVVEDGIQYAIPATVTMTELTGPQTTNTFYIGLSIGWPHVPDGASRDQIGSAAALRHNHPKGVIVSESRLGPYTRNAYSDRDAYHVTIRHSVIGPEQFGKRRGTNDRVFHFGESTISGSVSVFDNILEDGAKRFVELSQMSSNGSWYGFNYHTDMLATAVGETGSHWNDVGTPQGISMFSDGGCPTGCEPRFARTVFWSHDTNTTSAPGLTLIEANDMAGHQRAQGNSGDMNRYTTLFRNRQNRETLCGQGAPGSGTGCGSPDTYEGAGAYHYTNWIANRFVEWASDATREPNTLGRWNVAEEASGARTKTATGATWPTASTYKNYVDTGPHDDYATTRIPPSLALKTGTPPSWWCTESGTWNDEWSFGYGDGGDNGGTPRKLPAQIRYEGGTCTTPTP